MNENLGKRIFSLLLAAVMLCSYAVPGTAVTAFASEVGETSEPTEEPASEPTEEPASEPTEEPTSEPTEEPTSEPTEEPTSEPTEPPAVHVAVAATNGTVTDENGLELEGINILPGVEFVFRVLPEAGCEVHSVMLVGKELSPEEDGSYIGCVDEDCEIVLICADVTPPSVQLERQTEAWCQEAVYTVVVHDNLDGALSVAVNGNAVEAQADGTYTVTFTDNGTYIVTVTDAAGLEATATVEESKIDSIDPAFICVERNAEGWQKDSVSYTAVLEESQSGIYAVTVSVNGGSAQTLIPTQNGEYIFSVAQSGTVVLNVYDIAGNTAEYRLNESLLDNNAPVISRPQRETKGWAVKAIYSFQASDEGSGIAEVALYDGVSQISTPLFAEEDGSYRFEAFGNGTYAVTVRDNAGHISRVEIEEAEIDTESPVISACDRITEGWAKKAEYRISAEDALSGISKVFVVTDEGESEICANEDGTYTATVQQGEEVTVFVRDNAGNETFTVLSDDRLDNVSPIIVSVTRTQQGWLSDSASYSIVVEDALSGVSGVYVQTEDGEKQSLAADEPGIYTAVRTANGQFTVVVCDGAGNEATQTVTERRIDAADPQVSELVRVQENWIAAAEYIFSAEDLQSGIVEVVLRDNDSGEEVQIQTDEDGNYHFVLTQNGVYVLSVTDRAQRTTEISVLENRVDGEKPVVGQIHRDSEGWAKKAAYTFSVADNASGIATVEVLLDGEPFAVLSPDADGNCVFETTLNGTYAVVVTDATGNAATVTFSEQQVDITDPIITDYVRQVEGWTKEAVYSFSASDSGSGVMSVEILLNGEFYAAIPPAEDGSYAFSVASNGTYSVRISDYLGNTATVSLEESLNDTTAPECTALHRESEGWAKKAVYSFTVSDFQSGAVMAEVMLNGEALMRLFPDTDGCCRFEAEGNGTYTITVLDMVGNCMTVTVEESHIDLSAPQISQPQRNAESWQTSAAYHFTVSDPGSGVATVEVLLNGKPFAVLSPDAEGNCVFETTLNGTYTVIAKDLLGSVAEQTAEESLIDTTAPAISVPSRSKSGWQTEAEYSFAVTEQQSGIATVTVSIDGGEAVELTAENGLYRFAMSANGSFRILATDAMGNTSEYIGEEALVDTAAPAFGEIRRQAEGWQTSATYSFCIEEVQSGTTLVKLITDSGSHSTLYPDENGVYTFVLDRNGAYSLFAADKVGNTATISVAETHIDTTAPELTDIVRDPQIWSQNGTYTFHVADSQSGLKSLSIQMDGREVNGTWTAKGECKFVALANGTYTVTVTDKVGNSTTVQIAESLVDVQAPVIAEVSVQGTWDAESNDFAMKVTDESELVCVTVEDESGLQIPYSKNGDDYSGAVTKNGTYTVTAADRAGNCTTVNFEVWHIDTAEPSVPKLESTGAELWVNTDVQLSAASSDEQSGVAAYWYSTESGSFDRNTWIKIETDGTQGVLVLTAEQDSIYNMVAEDGVGRVSQPASIRVAIDKTAPAEGRLAYITDIPGYNKTVENTVVYNDKAVFFASASDTACGVVRYEYRVETADSTGEWICVEADASGFYEELAGEDMLCRVFVKAYDLAGNCSEVIFSDLSVCVENTPTQDADRMEAPTVVAATVSGTYSGAWTAQNVKLSVFGSDAISGIARYEYRVDNADPAIADLDWQAVPNSNGVYQIIADCDTNAVYSFRAVTYADNCSNETSVEVLVQKTAPEPAELVCDEPTGQNGWYTVYPGYSVQTPEQNSYFAPVEYLLVCDHDGEQTQLVYNGSNAPVVEQDGLWQFRITAVDAAGNEAAVPSGEAFLRVDTKAPDNLTVILEGEDILNLPDSGVDSWDGSHFREQVAFSDFSVFRNKAVTVYVHADGGDSGLAALYCQSVASNDRYDPDGTWVAVKNGKVELKPDNKYHLFFKAVDNAGNTCIFSADSILLDGTDPGGNGTDDFYTEIHGGISAYGYYAGDVRVNVAVMEPIMGENAVFAGLTSVSYKVLSNGEVTQQGRLFPGDGETAEQDGRICGWAGTVKLDSALNDSNSIVVEITAVDAAGNSKTTRIRDGKIRIDVTDPEVYASFDNNDPAAIIGGVNAFTGSRTLSVTVLEKNFVPEKAVITVKDTDSGTVQTYNWNNADDMTHTAQIPITADGHYEVSVSVADAAGNIVTQPVFENGTVGKDLFIIDNTAPEISLSYNNNDARNGKYFNTARIATVTVVERNFDPAKISALAVLKQEDGTTVNEQLGAWRSNGNVHTAELICDMDGIYTVSVSGTDPLGNQAGNTKYTGTAPTSWVLDKIILKPIFDNVQSDGAYSGKLIPVLTVKDVNLDSITLTMTRSNKDMADEDVSQKYLSNVTYEDIEGGVKTVLDLFSTDENHDGIYRLTAACSDLAGNAESYALRFTICREGSVYEYSEDLLNIMGSVMQKMDKDLIITEYNPAGFVAGSQRVTITLDGVPVSNVQYEVENATGGASWQQSRYVISKDNFTKDGVYEVVVSAQDAAGNIPENTDPDTVIRFGIDTTAPELPSIIGMEKAIVKADSATVTLSALDNVALGSIVVYIDGEEVSKWEDLDSYSCEQSFRIGEGYEQHIRIVITDKAGNVLDTDSEEFAPGYGFEKDITVSSNAWLRYYANKPLFFGSIGGGVAAGAGIMALLGKKKKKEQK